MSWYSHWNFIVAIAFNILLISINIFLVFKIQKWRRLLYKSRQQFRRYEQQVQIETEMILRTIHTLPPAANEIIQKKRKIKTFITQGKTLLVLLKKLRNLV